MPPTSSVPIDSSPSWPRRIAPWALGALVVLLSIRVALPPVLTHVASTQLSEALSASVTIEDTDLWVFGGGVQFEGVAISPLDGGQPWLTSERLRANVAWFRLLGGTVQLEELELGNARLILIHGDDGSIRWPGDVAGAEEPEPEGELEAEAGSELEDDGSDPLEIVLERVILEEIAILLRDEPGKRDLGLRLGEIGLGPVRIVLSDPMLWSLDLLSLDATSVQLRNDDESALDVEVSLTANGFESEGVDPGRFVLSLKLAGGTFEAKGHVMPEPLAANIELQWSDLELAPFAALAPDGSRPTIESGTTSGRFALNLGALETPAESTATTTSEGVADDEEAEPQPSLLSGEGEVHVAALDLTQGSDAPLGVAWENLSVGIASLRVPIGSRSGSGSEPGASAGSTASEVPEVRVSSIDWASPRIRVTRSPAAPEPEDADAPAEADEEAGGESPSPARVVIDHLVVEGAGFRLSDQTFEPPYDTVIDRISVDGRDLSWPDRAARSLAVSVGSLGEKPLVFTAKSDGTRGSGRLVGHAIPLLVANPYVRQGSSYTIDRGTMSIDSDFVIDGESYDAPTRIVFQDLAIGGADPDSRFEQQLGLSPGLALALLRDPEGDVHLDLPLEYGGDGADIGLMSVVGTTVRRVLVNALASPLKLASLVGGGGDAGESLRGRAIHFAPGEGEAEDRKASEEEVAGLVGLLKSKPELGIRIEAVVVKADLERIGEKEGLQPGEPADPAAWARAQLEELARTRLEVARRRVSDALDDIEDAGARMAVVPWDGTVGEGDPRVVAQIVLRSD